MIAKTLSLAVLGGVLLAASAPRAAADTASDALHRFFAEEWEWDMADGPENASLLGDRRYDDRWTDLSPEAVTRRKQHLDERLRRARAFDPQQLGAEDRLSLELFIDIAERDRSLARFPQERLAIGPLQGPHRDLPSLAVVPRFVGAAQLRAWVKRLRAIPAYIDQTIALLELGRQSGWVAARDSVRDVPAQIRAIRSAKPDDSVFFTPFKNATGVPAAELASLAEEARGIITRSVDPAFERLAAYTETTYLPAARKDVGAWSLPDGAAYYAACVEAQTTTSRTPDEIYLLGLSEVKRIRAEMDAVMKSAHWTGTRAQWNDSLRTDPKFFYHDGAQLLTGYRDIAKRIDGELPKLFGKLPRLTYGVVATPAFEAPTSMTAYYRQGSPQEGRAADFVANTYLPETRPKWEMEALTLHEAVPGHHLQIALQQELDGLPRFRQEASFTAFVEGWGLYAESLGPQLGMFTDPYSKYGQLTYEMWRAVRLVVDTGMHAKKWTRQQAIDYFIENTPKTRHDVEVEVDRYIVWPGQALAYKTGELEIKRLRAYAEKALGPRFDIRRFHDAVLAEGALPLGVLDRRIHAFVEEERGRPLPGKPDGAIRPAAH